MSSSAGMPTAVPWARSSRCGHCAYRRSSVGVSAAATALPSLAARWPTPSMTTVSTGPRIPAKPLHRRSTREESAKQDVRDSGHVLGLAHAEDHGAHPALRAELAPLARHLADPADRAEQRDLVY